MRQKKRQARINSYGHRKAIGKICSGCIDNAMGKMEETDSFIDYGKAEGDESVNASCNKAV